MSEISNDGLASAERVMRELLRTRPVLTAPEIVISLKEALLSAEREWALYIVLILDAEMTRQLLPQILQAGFRHRDALLVREIIGTLPRHVLVSDLLPLIGDRMSRADEDEFRRMAELLEHVGLVEALNAMAERGMESDDPGIREAASDISYSGSC